MLNRAVSIFVLVMLTPATPALAAANFVRAGDMAFGRFSFPAVTLPDGTVLVASDNTAERYDPATDSFTLAGFMTTNRGFGLTATLLPNGRVLIVGGQAGDASQASAELYDSVAGTFTPTGSMATPRSFHAATLLSDGRVLITGGHQFNFPNSALATAEIYDPDTGTFTLTGSMSAARQDHTGTVLPGGRVLIAGGYGPSQLALSSTEIYDPDTGTFTTTGSMAAGRGHHTATLLGNGKILIAGGHTAFPGGSLSSAELYDPAGGNFASTGDMTAPRGAHTATLLPEGTVLIAGGYTAFPFLGTTLASAEIYDPSAGSFAATAGMQDARGRQASATLLGGEVLVAGGFDQCCINGLSSAEIFSEVITVAIDIKPGSFPNSINLSSHGTVAVAIFSSITFDATTVDPATVTLASAAVKLKGQGTPMASFEDVNGDSLLDLVVHLSTEALQLSDTDAEAALEGQTFAGVPITGKDSVRIVP